MSMVGVVLGGHDDGCVWETIRAMNRIGHFIYVIQYHIIILHLHYPLFRGSPSYLCKRFERRLSVSFIECRSGDLFRGALQLRIAHV